MEIVLVHPQIPQNTGSIARTCAATQIPLHLIEPLGFHLSEKAVRRAGLDYWPFVNVRQHESWTGYLETCKPRRVWAVSKFGTRIYSDADFSHGDALVFGSETKGLGEEFLATVPNEQILRIPMWSSGVRSLNLSNAVAIVLYEALRQIGFEERERQLQTP